MGSECCPKVQTFLSKSPAFDGRVATRIVKAIMERYAGTLIGSIGYWGIWKWVKRKCIRPVQSADEEAVRGERPDQWFRDFADCISPVDNDACQFPSLQARSLPPWFAIMGRFILKSTLMEASC
jgi:hypothetical protein